MKYSAAILALAAAVYAQDISIIPACALPCIDSAVKTGTTCSTTDYKCICANKDALTAGATTCVISACGAEVGATQVLPAVQKFCEQVAAAPASSSAAAPSSSAAAATSSAAAATSSAAAATSSAAAATSSAAAATSTAKATTSAAASAYPTTVVSSTTKASNGTSSTAAPSSVVTAGAAVAGSIGSLAMMALGLAAAL